MKSVATLDSRNTPISAAEFLAQFRGDRARSEAICRPLTKEDCQIQSMPDVSPPKWHLAHTAWFYETFVLRAARADYRPFDDTFAYLFNSYYQSLGTPYPRAKRGVMSRPELERVLEYRHHVDRRIEEFCQAADARTWRRFAPVLELGIHHEAQHQELLFTDIQHILFVNPLRPPYRESETAPRTVVPAMRWIEFDEGIRWIGDEGDGFAFDNERPKHRVFMERYALASRLVTNQEYLAFIDEGGYLKPELWLSDGWDAVRQNRWEAPLYWEKRGDAWWRMSLSGMRPVAASEPVAHLSYYEADAFARWAGKRLPTEAEWEIAASSASGCQEMFEVGWQWTASSYQAYPGYRVPEGAIGEYNGKFMCNQMVLRGGSRFSPPNHLRASYRNFFPAPTRWQCSGLRLAEDR